MEAFSAASSPARNTSASGEDFIKSVRCFTAGGVFASAVASVRTHTWPPLVPRYEDHHRARINNEAFLVGYG